MVRRAVWISRIAEELRRDITIDAARTGNKTAFLTLLGGGVFGNPITWILDAIERAAALYAAVELDVAIVS